MKPVYRFDSVSRIHWMEFSGKPDQETIDLLKREGWRWSGYRRQWHTNRRFAKPPVGIEYEDGGECDYSSERPDRLQHAAVRASERSEAAYERSNALVEGIPMGQPVLVGHHSQRRHEKTLEQSRNAMSKSVEEQKKAEHLEYKARSSARHQAYKERPDVIARRIKRLKGEITSMENSHKRDVFYALSEVKYGSITEEQAKQKIEHSKQWLAEKRIPIEQEIAENEAALAEAGGLIADSLNIEVGDVIKGGWRGLCEVIKLNKRNGAVLSYTCRSLTKTWMSKCVIPKDEVYGLALKKDDVTSEALLQAKFEAEHGQPSQPQPAPEQKEFKVQAVQTVEVYNNATSLFPTPYQIGVQLASQIPTDAHLILEPSAGNGALINAVHITLNERQQAHTLHCCEILPQLRDWLAARYTFVASDFLAYHPDFLYDAIVMNPPFKNTDWLDHIEHALTLLKPGGTLLAIVPQGFVFRQEKRIKAFRELVEEHGSWEQLPEDTFVESGTAVRTVMLSLVKPLTQETSEDVAHVTLWS